MKENNLKNVDENPIMIILGVLVFYLIVVFFIFYLVFLHRITPLAGIISEIVFSLIYLPRFLILKRIKTKDVIRINDNSIGINGENILFSEIEAYKVDEKKPQVVFFMNYKMIVFYYAIFYLKLKNGQISFNAIGSEKIALLKNFFDELLR